jgi:hypothetical protein
MQDAAGKQTRRKKEFEMTSTRERSSRWLKYAMIVILAGFLVGLGVILWNSQAAPPPPQPASAFIQLSPTSGNPGTIVTVSGGGWQVGETILIYLVEAGTESTDNVVYASAIADHNGRIASNFRYPLSGPWVEAHGAIASARGIDSGRQALAAFQVIQPTALPTAEPDTVVPPPATDTSQPDTPIPATNTPIPATETPAPTPVTPGPTSAPPTATPKPPAPTATPIVITEWRGEYFNNVSLAGSPLVRNDIKVNFEWGAGSPMKGINADQFSARWTRRLEFEARVYRFYVRVDDGARLWIDGQLVLDQWQDGPPRTHVVERVMTRGWHDVRLEMYERTGGATAVFWREAVASYPDWKGEYFDNLNLAGNPVLTRNDLGIDFRWGRGAPAPGLPADNFSVRWTRQVRFPAGPHRFFVEVDDGARLWVDGRLVIDQWHDGVGSYAGDIYLSEGNHSVRLETYERAGEATARMWWAMQKNFPEWKGEYFANRKLKGDPALVRNDKKIDFNWGSGAPAAGLPRDEFSARWTRQLRFQAGAYRFYVEVDDGARLWVDGKLVIDRWHDGAETYSGDMLLAEGKHTVKLEMYERSGGARIHLWWESQSTFPDWKGRYFANRELKGDPVMVRNDVNIDFDWGAGAPSPSLPADNFGVRWTRTMNWEEGTYRFCARADDGVRVALDDGAPFIDQWHDGSGTYCADIDVGGGSHKLQLEYYEHQGQAVIQLTWNRLSASEVPGNAMRRVEGNLWATLPAYTALASEEQYRAFLDQSGVQILDPQDENPPDFRWGEEVILGAFLGEMPTEGYALDVTRIVYRGTEVTVHLAITQPGPADVPAQVVTSPYVLIGVEWTALPAGVLTFAFVDQNGGVRGQASVTTPGWGSNTM